jgi:hypothetical protein
MGRQSGGCCGKSYENKNNAYDSSWGCARDGDVNSSHRATILAQSASAILYSLPAASIAASSSGVLDVAQEPGRRAFQVLFCCISFGLERRNAVAFVTGVGDNRL